MTFSVFPKPLLETALPLASRRQGKVRDVYPCTTIAGNEALLIVASDRISAYDVVMPTPIPGKGIVLTQLSCFWFEMITRELGGSLQHHLISTDPADVAGLSPADRTLLCGRVMIGRRTRVIPIECVVRGYLAGSGWAEYQQSRSVCGVALPEGLQQCEALPEPIFTPASKADAGHDENISFEQASAQVGEARMERLRELSLAIYDLGRRHAASRGILLADTKFEFGIPLDDPQGEPILIDEVLTPDSSRFWPADGYQPGRDQPSFDKQFVRNYLTELVREGKWNRETPGPQLPENIVNGTLEKYLEAYHQLVGAPLNLAIFSDAKS